MKLFSIWVIAILLLQAFAEASSFSSASAAYSLENVQVNEGSNVISVNKINCDHACSRRCSKAFKKKRCKRACKACCNVCHCVPPGTYGHKELCPCYAKLKTHGHKPKCP